MLDAFYATEFDEEGFDRVYVQHKKGMESSEADSLKLQVGETDFFKDAGYFVVAAAFFAAAIAAIATVAFFAFCSFRCCCRYIA